MAVRDQKRALLVGTRHCFEISEREGTGVFQRGTPDWVAFGFLGLVLEVPLGVVGVLGFLGRVLVPPVVLVGFLVEVFFFFGGDFFLVFLGRDFLDVAFFRPARLERVGMVAGGERVMAPWVAGV